MSAEDDGSAARPPPPPAVGPPPSLYPQIGPGPAAPQPAPLSSASTLAGAASAPEMKPRQVTPEDGDASAVPPPPPPLTCLSRTTTESMGVLPTHPAPVTGVPTSVPTPMGSVHVKHNGGNAGQEDTFMSEADVKEKSLYTSTSSKALENTGLGTNHLKSPTETETGKDVDQRPSPSTSPTRNFAAGTAAQQNANTGSSPSSISGGGGRGMAFHGTLCLNTKDLTDQDGTEDTETLAVFRDALDRGPPGQQQQAAVSAVASAAAPKAQPGTTCAGTLSPTTNATSGADKTDDTSMDMSTNMETDTSTTATAATSPPSQSKPPAQRQPQPQIDVADTLLKQAQMVQAPKTVPAVDIVAQMMAGRSPVPTGAADAGSTGAASTSPADGPDASASTSTSTSTTAPASGQPFQASTTSVVGSIAQRAQQQAVDAHVRAETALALARQAAELEAMERNLAGSLYPDVAEEGAATQAQVQERAYALAQAQAQGQQLHNLMLGGGLYPDLSRGASASSTGGASVTNTAHHTDAGRSSTTSPGGAGAAAAADNHHAAFTSLLESQRIREQPLAVGAGYHNPSALLGSSYYSQLPPPTASSGLSAHVQQLMSSSTATPSSNLFSGNSNSLQRLVEQEEQELRALQLQLQQQQQQLSLRSHLAALGVGSGGGGGLGLDLGLGLSHGHAAFASAPQQQFRLASVGIGTAPSAAAAETTYHANTSAASSLISAPKGKGPMKKRLKHAHDLSLAQEAAAAASSATGGSKTMVMAQPKMAGTPMYQYTTTLPPPPVPPPGYFPAGQPTQRLLLYSPEDHHWLSDQLCFVRKLIEIFEANEEDVTARSRRGGMKKPIRISRVGLRCVFCSNVPARQRAKGAVSYPNSIRIVHQAIRNFQRYHLMQCPNMPQSIKNEYKSLKTTRCHSGNASLQYWVTSSHALGMRDTDPDNGIRLQAPPPRSAAQAPAEQQKQSAPSTGGDTNVSAGIASGAAAIATAVPGDTGSRAAEESCSSTTLVLGDSPHDINASNDPGSLGGVSSGDLQTTPYMSLILAQQRPTSYQPADSLGKRRPRPSGFPGMECKHCSSPSRVASPGRYFPLTTTVLANNNNPGGCVYVHLMKCGRCPQDVKINLQRLAERHTLDGENLDRGWRRKVFSSLWERLHNGRVWSETELAQALASDKAQYAEENMETDQEGRPTKEGSDDVGTAAKALSALSCFSGQGKRKMPPDDDDDDADT